ncbi:Outer membrane efflux protein [Ketogulonicigenium robustum]|uniref:Outer membrane efflux protein n=1 Tax=Ketogulonicigenium robustum TaxID=92947 RepID=A0A1W6NWE7_9RHOB|nr:TolC family outer membrane protein [Ketogulonicigenium robustum]ARO13556.1 Outer membrane efflux protein [Ketogulonicigenium robustum]
MINKLRSIVVGVVVSMGVAAPAAHAETLADAMAWAYESSGLLTQNRALLRAADEGVAQSIAALRPILNWSANISSTFPNATLTDSPFTTATLGITASLTLYDGGRGRMGVDAAKESVLGTRANLLAIEQQVLLRVVNAYMNVKLYQEFVSLRENNVRVISEELRAAQDQYEVGQITRTSVAQAEAALATARATLVSEQGNLTRAREEYRVATGRLPGALAAATPARITQSLEEARAIALQRHPAIVQARHTAAAADINVERARTATIPTVSGTANLGRTHYITDSQTGIAQAGSNSDSLTVGIGISGPIYQGGALASQMRQVMANRDASRAALLTASDSVSQSVANAYSLREVARVSRESYASMVTAAQLAFDGTREEASLGAATTVDVLDAEQTLLDARASQISAQYNEITAGYSVLSSMGLLTAENLGLNVQIYDPTAYYNLVDDAPGLVSAQGRALDRVLQAIGRE